MDNYTLQSIKEIFGTNFQQYCERHKIILKKDNYDTFMVPNVSTLAECIDVLDGFKLKIDNKLKQIQKRKSSLKNQHTKRLHKKCKITKKEEPMKCKNISRNSFLTDLELHIRLYDTSSIVPAYTVHTVSPDYILNTANTGNEIYEYILKKTMKNIDIVNYETSIPLICTLLNQFQKRHKRFHYSSVLKEITEKQACNKKLKCKYGIPLKQLKSFFDLIFAKVVPLAIFGKLKNLKKVKKAMYQLLIIPRFKSLDLMYLIEKLDIYSIIWLNNIPFLKTQWLILAKFIKWFFNGYLLKILRIQFHITTLSATNNERVYIARPNWCCIQNKFIKKKIFSNCLQPDIKCNEWNPPIGAYKLCVKMSNVRPIFLSEYQEVEKKDLQTIFTFLRQLQITESGFADFQKTWKSVVQRKYNSGSKQFYLVSCDVKDAFGSIIQAHLYDIIMLLCQKLPEVLVINTYAVKSEKYKGDDIVCYKQYFTDANLQLPLPPGSLYACTHSNSLRIRKRWLLQKIKKYIFYQRIKIREKTYIIAKGIVQGTMLSPVLSDIYYNYVLQKHISSFLHCGEIVRYMDDILYATENEILAKEFLQLIKNGIPRFNCYFKELKTQSNIINASSTFTNNIDYIGYKINCDTLEVEPKDLSAHMRYLISFTLKNNITPLELFRKRLSNVPGLNLSKVVLDHTINSKATVIKILQKTCLMQAKRAQVLIKELFDDIEHNIQDIIIIIKITNKKVARHVMKILLRNEEKMNTLDMCIWNKKILHILSRSYERIFRRDKILGNSFKKILRKNNKSN